MVVLVESSVVPFNRPSFEGDELAHVATAVGGGVSSAKGPFSEQVSELFRDAIGSDDVLLTTSCTAALELAAMLMRFEPGDNVIVPSFTFVTTASAFAREGAELRFADIEPARLGLDPDSVAAQIDERTRAVVVVHYAGVAADLEGLERVLADWPDVVLIEDNAHGLFGSQNGRPLGSFGRFATLSFHETKNFICGEGGALLLNDPADVEAAHVLYDKGTNRRQFFAGDVDKYSWIDRGSSFGLSDLLAACLLGQLEQRDAILAKRAAVFDAYAEALTASQERLGYRLPIVPDGCEQAYHMFYVVLSDAGRRDSILQTLRDQSIKATFHYVPLHDAEGAKPHTTRSFDCPVTDDISSRLIRLPFFNNITDDELARVVESFLSAAERF